MKQKALIILLSIAMLLLFVPALNAQTYANYSPNIIISGSLVTINGTATIGGSPSTYRDITLQIVDSLNRNILADQVSPNNNGSYTFGPYRLADGSYTAYVGGMGTVQSQSFTVNTASTPGGGSGGGGGGTQYYTITIASVDGGTATVTLDKEEAAEGQTVTVTIRGIESGKQFKSITVKDADNNEIMTTAVNAGETYTFAMPASDVTVTVELEAVAPATYTVTIADVVGGTATVTLDKEEAAEGQTVTVNISGIQSGKKFKSITVKAADGSTVTTTPVSVGASYTFTMPAKAVTVTVELETETVTINATSGSTYNIGSSPTHINVPAGVANTAIKITPGIELPRVEVQTNSSLLGTVQMTIPEGTVVRGGDGWDGTSKLPAIKAEPTKSVPNAKSIDAVIEIGLPDSVINFSKAVRICIPGKAGKSVGYIKNGVFTAITRTITADKQETADAEIPDKGDGKINSGNDLVIWTKHFTEFVVYTPSESNSSSSSSNSTAVGGASTTSTATSTNTANTSDTSTTDNSQTSTDNSPASSNNTQSTVLRFSDMEKHWARSAVMTLVDKGAISGYPDGTFRPDRTMTRTEFAILAARAMGLQPADAKFIKYKDKNAIPRWAQGYIAAAAKGGLFPQVWGTSFKPSASITRADMAYMIGKALKAKVSNKPKLKFKDKVPSWAAGYVAYCQANKIISGYPDQAFKPAKAATRAEACTIIANALKISTQ